MKVVGHHEFSHDASIVVINEAGDVEFYGQAERFGPRNKCSNDINIILDNIKEINIDSNSLLVTTNHVCNSSPVGNYDPLLIRKCNYVPTNIKNISFKNSYCIDHHLAHGISSWCFRPDDKERLIIISDGCGKYADCNKDYKASLVGEISSSGFSVYYDAVPIPSSALLWGVLGPNSAGKAMGLAGFYPEINETDWTSENVSLLLDKIFNVNLCNISFPEFNQKNESEMRFVASFYKWYIGRIWEKIKINLEKYSNGRGVVVGGGTHLALELNTNIYNYTKDLVFGPAINDSGLALGAAAFGYFHLTGKWPKINSASLNFHHGNLPFVGPQEPYAIAKILSENKTVALLRGKAEAGPRALGYRSLFASAMIKDNLRKVSQEIKGREFYRPLAPIVIEEAFDNYFVGPKGEYMQYRVLCNDYAKSSLPAIVHADSSARPQVVYKQKDPWLHSLISEYGKITGHPCFINTSLNGAGKPICNTYKDAFDDMKDKEVVIISVPNSAKNKIFI